MKIQIDIQKELNTKLKIEKAQREEANLEQTITRILNEYFKKK